MFTFPGIPLLIKVEARKRDVKRLYNFKGTKVSLVMKVGVLERYSHRIKGVANFRFFILYLFIYIIHIHIF